MSETYTLSAKTVDEAVDLASRLYGGKNKEISHVIVSLPKKGFLGIGSKDAVIRVTVTDTDDDGLSSIVNELKNYKHQVAETGYYTKEESEKPEEKKPQPKAEEKKPHKAEKHTQTAEAPEKKAESTEKCEKCEKTEEKKPHKSQKKHKKPQKSEKAENVQKAEKTEKAEKPQKSDEVRVKSAVSEEEMVFAIDFIDRMIANMQLCAKACRIEAPEDAVYNCTETETVYPAVNIVGEDTGILIGHHGETLDAIQYLVNLALYRRCGNDRGGRDSIKITVDIENYREKREETLRALARRMASRAVKYKRNVFLEPMNPYERRIIHSELQEYPDVATHSVGSDTNRKIIITYEGADKAQSNGRRRGRGRRSSNGNARAAETQVAQALPLPTLDDILD